ncbi:MAG: S53 family peptidase [Acidimicrobiales bacterium]
MRVRLGLAAGSLVVGALALSPVVAARAATPAGGSATAVRSLAHTVLEPGCALARGAGVVHCDANMLGLANGQPLATSGPSGYGPKDIQSAYGLAAAAASSGSTQTVAIVDAYDDPSAAADMAHYRSTYGLPACGTGCFTKVNQTGRQGSYPSNDVGWGVEISLDLDMVSATCPKCHILLVEARSPTTANLGTGVNTAVRLGANAVSNSYGGNESATDPQTDAKYYTHPGVAVTASSGDSGYGVSYPAASPHVTSVGGTTLNRASNARGWSETAWSGAGSGCSSYEAKPSWQADKGCAKRTVADVSAVADPNTGVAVYDSNCDSLDQLLGNCFSGFGVVGGTSVSSPIVASVYGLAGNAASFNYASYPYAHTSALHDVTSGSNGVCTTSYLCTAGSGYDGPTGLGTPSGTGAF